MKRKERRVYMISRSDLYDVKVGKKVAGKKVCCEWCNKNFKILPTLGSTFYMLKEKDHGIRFVCYKCAHRKTLQRQRYGFWLRFLSEHFIPCEECQDKLHELINTNEVDFHKEYNSITLIISEKENKLKARFKLGFLWRDSIFTPCKLCQKKIVELWQTNELHIGNDIKPMVELWRDWADVEEKGN